jgi:hypothetical protein
MGASAAELERLAAGMAGEVEAQVKPYDAQTTAAAALITASGVLLGLLVRESEKGVLTVVAVVLTAVAIAVYLVPAAQYPSLYVYDLDLLLTLYVLTPTGVADLWLARVRAAAVETNDARVRLRTVVLVAGTIVLAAGLVTAAVAFGRALGG